MKRGERGSLLMWRRERRDRRGRRERMGKIEGRGGSDRVERS